MTQTLYLGAEAQQVRLDGPSLLVSAQDRADARVPLRVLARVVARSSAEWSTAAIVACLAGGIPITFLRGDGATLGFCLPSGRRSADLARLLEIAERRWDGPAGFANWARAEERRAILRLISMRPVQIVVSDPRPEQLRAAILAAAGSDRPHAASILAMLEGMLAAHLPQILLASGLPARWAAPSAPGRMDLFGTCLQANRWHLVPLLEQLMAHRRRHPDAWGEPGARGRRIARSYEGRSSSIAGLVRAQLRRLEMLLWEDIE